MLPPGHIAAGYLTAKVLTSSLQYNLTASQINELSLIGAIVGFLPDLDFFFAFAKLKAFRIDNQVVNHRKLFPHAPILWLIAGLIIFFLTSSDFGKALGLVVWLSSWSHFILDSEWGIMWLWPATKRFFPFSEAYYSRKYQFKQKEEKSFLKYWFNLVVKEYSSFRGSIEIFIVLIALIVLF